VLDEVRPAAQEALVEQRRPLVPVVRAAEQGLADIVVAVHGRDAEVVPLTAVQVQHDRAESEDLGDRLRDQGKDRREVALGADEVGYPDERADTGELRAVPATAQTRKARPAPRSATCSIQLAADGTVLLVPMLPPLVESISVRAGERIAQAGDLSCSGRRCNPRPCPWPGAAALEWS
jgi:hypothetical protein